MNFFFSPALLQSAEQQVVRAGTFLECDLWTFKFGDIFNGTYFPAPESHLGFGFPVAQRQRKRPDRPRPPAQRSVEYRPVLH